MHQRLLKLGQEAQTARGGGDELQLLGGVDGSGTRGGGNIEAVKNDRGGPAEQADRGTGDGDEDQHGRRHGYGKRLSPLKGERLGHQLAGDDVEISDERKAQNHSDDVTVELRVRQRAEPAAEQRSGQRLAQPAESQRAQRDAELDCGEQVFKVALKAAYGFRAGDAGLKKLLDARFANGDERELGGHEVGVGQDEHGHGNRLEEQQTVHLAERIASSAGCGFFSDWREPRRVKRRILNGGKTSDEIFVCHFRARRAITCGRSSACRRNHI